MTYIGYTNPLPDGYRWATDEEAESWAANDGSLAGEELLWVAVGRDHLGNEAWDLAVPDNFHPLAKTCPPIPGILQ